MKKALLAGMCFVLISLLLVSGTFALPNLDTVFSDLTGVLGDLFGLPEKGGPGTAVDVSLIADNTPQQLFPGGSASRFTSVRNEGEGEVYFRLVYAVQYDAESWNKLDISFTASDVYEQSDWSSITIDGSPYQMKVFTYKNVLPAGTDSPGITITIAMDDSITSQQLARYNSNFLRMQVLAIDPAPFQSKGYTTATEALNLALPLGTLNPF